MRLFRSALLYLALGLGANAALASDLSAIDALREGDMKKLVFTDAKPVSANAFQTVDGAEMTLSEYQGKWVLVNFWATWCAPCRKEMPMLSALQEEFGGDAFEVVTIATGRNPPPAMKTFFKEIGVSNLPLHRDPKQAVAREMAVLGLPITVLMNPEGQEVARLQGDADWASDSAKAIIKTLISDETGS
ncbi:TlpA family protein disulfide reductase [Primorskyibacter flagellatus]|uniref:Thiol-disulfide isomerase or thioredoxin n=1 Tax=Primorskyibacter flagellatus TaxID=1387277 RepID=A0A1W2AYJ8_9RHOB|nr:TlpA disulfide reductase family protein [Primorskyibacter flagellatus]SMC65789.1 Thiol-disulfide isomerase or thioredoxin [Primorskyibacter flagellatus]